MTGIFHLGEKSTRTTRLALSPYLKSDFHSVQFGARAALIKGSHVNPVITFSKARVLAKPGQTHMDQSRICNLLQTQKWREMFHIREIISVICDVKTSKIINGKSKIFIVYDVLGCW